MFYLVLKTLHFACLLGGGASLIGNGILMRKLATLGGPPPDVMRQSMRVIGQVGLMAVILMWVSGLAMLAIAGYSLGPYFAIKLLGALALLIAVTAMSVVTGRAARQNIPPNGATLKRLVMVARAGLAIALIFAVISFG